MKQLLHILTASAIFFCMESAGEPPYAWAELLAFDNKAPDYGVTDYLARVGNRPKAVSLLLCDADILHRHAGLSEDFPIGDRHSSYFARPGNEDRRRQNWSAWELRGLVSELARRGVKAYPSFFEISLDRISWAVDDFGEKPKVSLWVDEHPELFCRKKDGRVSRNLMTGKKLADGTEYRTFFARQTLRFLNDYGFAGIHLADGFGHPRFALCDTDFSDQTLDRFAAANPSLKLPASNRPDWILKYARREWCLFNADLHAGFVETLVGTLKPEGKDVWLNTCWTKDSHEALWRYGVDYRRLAASGIDGFFVESSATVLALEGWSRDPVSLIDDRRATLMRLASSVPAELVRLACIKDGLEQYSALRHAPTLLQAELLALSSVWRGGRLAAPSVMWCLTDGLTVEEGRKLKRWSEVLPKGCRPEGAFVVVSEAADRAEFAECGIRKMPTSQVLLKRLLAAGAIIGSSVDVKEAAACDIPVLVLNPGHSPAGELNALRRRKRVCVEFGYGDGATDFGPAPEGEESSSWLEPLPVREPSQEAVQSCVRRLNDLSPCVMDRDMKELRLVACRDRENRLIVVARNVRPTYLEASLRIRGTVERVETLTEDPSLPVRVKPSGDGFTLMSVKIPPSGAVCIRCVNQTVKSGEENEK